MALSDQIGIPEPFRPFLDGLLAVWIDLAIDAIAIRIGYWHWVIPLYEGWFGVPAGNLYAWIWVAFSFSAFARIVRMLVNKNAQWIWAYGLVPFFSYAGLFSGMTFVGSVGRTLGLVTQSERLWIFVFQFLIFLLITGLALKKRMHRQEPMSLFWFVSRWTLHLYFLIGFFIFEIYRQTPVLGLIALVMLGGEIALHRWLRSSLSFK